MLFGITSSESTRTDFVCVRLPGQLDINVAHLAVDDALVSSRKRFCSMVPL